jgi:hypothetical protein
MDLIASKLNDKPNQTKKRQFFTTKTTPGVKECPSRCSHVVHLLVNRFDFVRVPPLELVLQVHDFKPYSLLFQLSLEISLLALLRVTLSC